MDIVIFIPLLGTIIGAVLGFMFFKNAERFALWGALTGALAGAAGALLFMAPLQFCMFGPEQPPLAVALGFGLVVTGMIAFLAPLRWWARRQQQQIVASAGLFRGALTPWLFLLPTLIILILFLYYPFLDTFRLSTQLISVAAGRSRFICLRNFTDTFSNIEYWGSVLISFGMAGAIVALGMFSALLIAAVAFQPVKGAAIYRTLLIWPYALSPVVAGIIFSLIFNESTGLANYALESVFRFEAGLRWRNDATLAQLTVVLAAVWKMIGFNILFYIAGLQNVSSELREAAAIDGANVAQRFFFITVPQLSPITFFLLITNLTYAFFELFGTIDLMTSGGPTGATTVLIYRIFDLINSGNRIGLAAAQSLLLFMVVIGITALQFFTSGRRVNYGK
jgi:sn-glycerol 3-phosphate transport system permease protein